MKAGILTVEGEGGEPVSLSIKRGGGSAKLGNEDVPRAKLSVRLKVLVSDRTEEDFMAGSETNVATDEDERRAEELIASYIASLWETSKGSGCDLFLLARELYRKDPKAFEANVGLIPSGMGADIEVSVKGADETALFPRYRCCGMDRLSAPRKKAGKSQKIFPQTLDKIGICVIM